jgi:hypothetical protein
VEGLLALTNASKMAGISSAWCGGECGIYPDFRIRFYSVFRPLQQITSPDV